MALRQGERAATLLVCHLRLRYRLARQSFTFDWSSIKTRTPR